MKNRISTNSSIWALQGKDPSYEHFRQSESVHSKLLKKWVDEAYHKYANYLDDNFVIETRNMFYNRLWELELVEWLDLLGFKLVPTKKGGPDFCIQMDDNYIWIEAVLPKPSDVLNQWSFKENAFQLPTEEVVCKYISSIGSKVNIIKNKYLDKCINKNDFVLIAISGFGLGIMLSEIDLLQRAILPIGDQLAYFSLNNDDPTKSSSLPTFKLEEKYQFGLTSLDKQYIYPGNDNDFIHGILFSEASNLQRLLGRDSSAFSESTNHPHIFPNYSSKSLPSCFADKFYFHEFSENDHLISLTTIQPKMVD